MFKKIMAGFEWLMAGMAEAGYAEAGSFYLKNEEEAKVAYDGRDFFIAEEIK